MSDLATRVVGEARRWIGTPYRHQASCLGAGCDCLGLVRGVWRALFGAEPTRMPAYTADWAEVGGEERLMEAAMTYLRPVPTGGRETGDVLLFRWREGHPAKHCAVLSGPQRIIHAQEGAPVAEVTLGPWWVRRIAGVFRFPTIGETV